MFERIGSAHCPLLPVDVVPWVPMDRRSSRRITGLGRPEGPCAARGPAGLQQINMPGDRTGRAGSPWGPTSSHAA
jgi:hypothetical protein